MRVHRRSRMMKRTLCPKLLHFATILRMAFSAEDLFLLGSLVGAKHPEQSSAFYEEGLGADKPDICAVCLAGRAKEGRGSINGMTSNFLLFSSVVAFHDTHA